jgi:F-type H+-transporting ATPase subunit alpha
MVIFAGTKGYSDGVSLERIPAWESALLRYLETSHPEIGRDVAEKKVISEETETALMSALDAFRGTWQ